MKKIIFIRTAPYTYKQEDKNLYQSLDEIGLQSVQPHISQPSVDISKKLRDIFKQYKHTRLFCSEFIRSQETVRLLGNESIVASQLNEIRFSMNDFSSPEELSDTTTLKTETINRIRYNFSRVLLKDGLREKQVNIQQRIKEFQMILEQLPESAVALCCSHGFIMKLYENFFRNQGKTDSFEKLVLDYDWTKAPFGFLDGFVVSFDKSHIEVDSLNQ